MKNNQQEALIAESYRRYYDAVVRYIDDKVRNEAQAEDLAQDVWVRLITTDRLLDAVTLRSFIYTIARNIVNDYLRHLYIERAVGDIVTVDTVDDSTESRLIASDIAQKERERVECLPQQRRIIYVMSRYDGMSVDEIAESLTLSSRTVENHLRMGRRDVRAYISAIA